VVTVTDLFAPELSEYPVDIELECGETVPTAPEIFGLDNCAGILPVTFNEEVVSNGGTCPTIVRTWCAVDCVGNETCHTQTISTPNVDGLAFNPNVPTLAVMSKSSGMAGISVTAGHSGTWNLEILDINGRLVTPVFNGYMEADGARTFEVDPNNYAEAIYFVRFTNGEQTLTKKMVLMK
jgi:hypothetical protein